ncbi:uncharacterized protein FIBRA_01692 [Fibroporia radiculosa]|uniref:J domain-containing protein n=1 Tax=Fibroporia radiculosa TaxID=599839 RepID=J4I8M5_9APHY|nr:uncharacterized protein FIBRA_01692 [Fibroporia radiculosa]CCL99671.1 predicted protein [Fibroporia radiculosa]
MATTLYETLGLGRNASPEDIRKAYRRRALQTHPDRLPPNISATDKAVAEEEFRKVNNAYEVLNDEQNRKLYDRYGVWPPPATGPDSSRRTNHRQNSFDAFNFDPFGSFGHQQSFVFTDPFVLFNSLFGDIHQLHRQFFDDDPFSASQFHGAFGRSPFDRMGDPFGHTLMSPFGGSIFGSGPGLLGSGPMFSDFMGPNSRPGGASYGSVSEAVGRNGQWVSQSTVTRSINGRTETTTKRRDAEGNEHITYSSPEGERYTINGVEQPLPNGRAIASAPDPSQRTRPPPPLAIAAPPSTAAATAGSFAQPSASGFHAPSSSPHQPQPRAQAQQYPAYTQLSTSPPRRSPSRSLSLRSISPRGPAIMDIEVMVPMTASVAMYTTQRMGIEAMVALTETRIILMSFGTLTETHGSEMTEDTMETREGKVDGERARCRQAEWHHALSQKQVWPRILIHDHASTTLCYNALLFSRFPSPLILFVH